MWYRGTISDGIAKRPANSVTVFPNNSHSQDLPLYIQVAMNLSATNLWLQFALISSPTVRSYGEDH